MEYKRLTDLLELIIDNRGKTVPTVEKGIKLIATNCILNNKLFPVYEKVRYISQETYDTWFRAHPKPGDIIFVNKGTPGKVCMVPEPIDFCIAQDMMAFRADSNKIYNKYLFSVLRSKKIQNKISNSTVGTLIPHYKKEQLKDIIIPVPDEKTQIKIGNLYYDISFKIELNTHTNDNLLEIMYLKFNEWIENLHDYEISNLSSIANYKNGLAMQKYRPENEIGLPVIKIKEMNCGVSSETERCTSNIDPEVIINDGDVLFAWSGTLCMTIWDSGKAGLNQHIFKVTSDKYPKWFYYFWTLKHLDKFIQIAAGKATTMGHIKRGELDSAEVFIPSREELGKMNKIMSPILDKYIENKLENKTLEQLRDTLLPKLMNGEIDLDKIEI